MTKLNSWRAGVVRIDEPGNLYKVDISDDAVKNFLDWDKPLSQQPESVRKAIEPFIEQAKRSFPDIRVDDMTAGQFYQAYSSHRGGNAVTASEAFRAAGIPGIRYLDQGSRQGGKGTSNFVVFDENIVKMLERNGEKVSKGGLLGGEGGTSFQDALRKAQANASKPISEGGLGLPPNNTAADRARAMGFTTEGFRGSDVDEIAHNAPIWWTQDKPLSSSYASIRIRPPTGHQDTYAGNVMPLLVKLGKQKQFEKFNVGGVPDTREVFRGFGDGVETGLRRYGPDAGEYGGLIWEALTVPQNVRSKFAAFDPFLMRESGLLK